MINNEFCLDLRKDELPKASIPAPIKCKKKKERENRAF